MKNRLRAIYGRQAYDPDLLFGIWLNPFFIIRRGLINGVRGIAANVNGGRLLDVGCGSKPYAHLFQVDEYVGIDVEESGHNHQSSKIDKFYDGKVIPFSKEEFDWVFSSEALEHVFNIDELFDEINRVLKRGGGFAFTCPFVWDEHEQPYDFARYTSFAIEHLLSKHGFRLVKLEKSSCYFETVMQMLSAYLYQRCMPRNRMLSIPFKLLVVAPVNILGFSLGRILPKNEDFYHNNIVLARKV